MCDLLDIHGRTHSSPTPRSSDLWISTFDYLNREELKTSDLPNATDADKRSVALPGFDAANGPFFDRNASSGYPSFRIGATTATNRSEEHTSELQSLMRISYAVFCLKKTNTNQTHQNSYIT